MGLSTAKASGKRTEMFLIQTPMKDRTNTTRKMDLDSLHGKVEIILEVTTKMMSDTTTERCSGLMDLRTRENGPKVFSMVLE